MEKKRRRRLSRLERILVYQSTGGICVLCGEPVAFEEMHVHHHDEPFARSGRTLLPELKPAHALCNRRQGSK